GQALVARSALGQIEIVELPDLVTGPGTPLGRYLAALSAALESRDSAASHPEGFRGTPPGRVWADGLAELGAWTYSHIVGPLLEHTRGWALGHTPHLALVPLGELATIPYAAAWTADPALPGDPRSAAHGPAL